MKGKTAVLLSVLVALCMLCSCGGGSGSDSDSAQKAVAVGFDLNIVGDTAKAISVSEQSYDGIQFWYKAIPQWTSEYGNIQGDTRYAAGKDANNFVQLNSFTYSNPTGTVGYFAQGQWAFDIEVRTADGSAILWKTSDTVKKYINETEKNFTFTVTKNIDNTKKGTVTFNVTTNKKSITDFFEVSYTPINSTTPVTVIDDLDETGTGNVTADDAELSGSTQLDAGLYAITVKYYSAAGKLVGSSTVAAEVIPGGNIRVGGTIENQTYQQTAFTIKGMYKLGVTVEATQTTGERVVGQDAAGADIKVPTIVAGQPITFTATPSITDLAGAVDINPTYYYRWDNAAPTTTATYNPTPANPGDFYCDCIVYAEYEGSIIGSASFTFKFIAEVPAP